MMRMTRRIRSDGCGILLSTLLSEVAMGAIVGTGMLAIVGTVRSIRNYLQAGREELNHQAGREELNHLLQQHQHHLEESITIIITPERTSDTRLTRWMTLRIEQTIILGLILFSGI